MKLGPLLKIEWKLSTSVEIYTEDEKVNIAIIIVAKAIERNGDLKT